MRKIRRKRVAIHARVSTSDQHVENQFLDLREMAVWRGFEVASEHSDKGISGTKARRPSLDAMTAHAGRGAFSVALVAASDRMARSTKNFLEIIDELNSLNIEFISAREAIATSGRWADVRDHHRFERRTGTEAYSGTH